MNEFCHGKDSPKEILGWVMHDMRLGESYSSVNCSHCDSVGNGQKYQMILLCKPAILDRRWLTGTHNKLFFITIFDTHCIEHLLKEVVSDATKRG